MSSAGPVKKIDREMVFGQKSSQSLPSQEISVEELVDSYKDMSGTPSSLPSGSHILFLPIYRPQIDLDKLMKQVLKSHPKK